MPAESARRVRPLAARTSTLAVWALAGAWVSQGVDEAVAVLVLSLALFIPGLQPRTMVCLLIGSTFATRFRFDVWGAGVRLEHIVLLVCLASLALHGRLAAIASAVRDRTVILFAAFVAWSGLVSMLRAPEPGESLLIVGWLALDGLLLVALVASGLEARWLARQGVFWAGVAGAVALALWFAARAGLTSFGVQSEPVSGAAAAFGLSHEANILASTLALWLFVAVQSRTSVSARARRLVVALASAAIIVSFTRSAVVGILLGLFVSALTGARAGLRAPARTLVTAAVVVLVLAWLAPGVSGAFATRASSLVDFGAGTGRSRVENWATAVRDLNGIDWLVGLGSNSYGQRHLDPSFPGTNTPGYLGNLPLQVVYDTGLVGVVLIVGVVWTILPRTRHELALALGLLAVYLVSSVATSPFWFGTTWVIVAIGITERRRLQESARAHRGKVSDN